LTSHHLALVVLNGDLNGSRYRPKPTRFATFPLDGVSEHNAVKLRGLPVINAITRLSFSSTRLISKLIETYFAVKNYEFVNKRIMNMAFEM
jgi:hypothetical protein